ncbi:outer membrane protein assembly factor BamA [Desulfohalobium retbaense]|uniref:Outer membrane protein assembly factor BamA n=1 Tax=Desulfohalobium retbaense (strain ATCC 49708 / DSM 5692 / JCM 16813 / HR100) TaxID=485915 RepID=C8X518_DESRD|nr:outer membrane protein assembly factor BamA [Desulfohalobium retbaense]ACV69515.1 outer membrane protein assembly complex, YaeT protein [Desulfohalobium retbaense DSM 5692]
MRCTLPLICIALLVWALMGAVPPSVAAAQAEDTALVVLPFEINAEQNLDYLGQDLPEMLRGKLRDKGFAVRSQEDTLRLLQQEEVEFLNLERARDLALLGKAQYAIYGSLSQVGTNLSLDARLVEATGLKQPTPFFVVKEGLINLMPAVEELADKVADQILRKEKISEIKVEGNEILDDDVVLMRLRLQEGDTYDPKAINTEVKRLYQLGYFDDVRVEVEETREGKEVVFQVQEKPLIQAIGVKGADAIDKDDILEVMSTKTGAVLNPKVIAEDLKKIREVYRKEGYYQAEVDYELEQTDPRKARLNVLVEEGDKLYIEDIRIKGAKVLDPGDLKDELALSERGLFSWLTGRGVLKEELLDRDAAALEAYYSNRGFMDAKVGQPEVEYTDEGIVITFHVKEGDRYSVAGVDFSGDLLTGKKELAAQTQLDDAAEEKAPFDRSVLREDIQSLTDFYTNYGYAYAEVDVQMDRDRDEDTVRVSYNLRKNQKVYVRRVTIEGNTKTRDNVIRREMRLADGDMFSGAALRRSNVRLQKLDYFEKVDIQTVPTSDRERMDLVVQVKEKSTGMLSAGAGYSSVDSVFLSGQVKERNLFGKGYTASLQGTFSGSRTRYDLDFWNPHLYDSPLGAGTNVYYVTREYDDYDKNSIGGKVKFGYPLGEYTRLFWNYRLEKYTLDEIDEDEVDEDILEREGENWASAVYASIKRDTTNRRLNPSKGTVNTLSVEYAGGLIGGDDDFVKFIYDTSFYQPLPFEHIFHWHAQVGHVMENSDDEVPDFERFYLGGMDDVRGYPGREISPEDDSGDEIGGHTSFFTNFEYLFPLSDELGLMGLVFFDAGDTWAKDESFDGELYKAVGAGVRWYSPLGPLRLEYGYGLDEIDGETSGGHLEFSVGQFF